MMPVDLVLVRHGQSEGNAAIHRAERGDESAYTPEFVSRHSSEWRLTPKGILQAKETGEWLRQNGLGEFERYYVSDYLRAKETAAHLELQSALWYAEMLLRERDRGEIDVITSADRVGQFKRVFERRQAQSFYWKPPGGESMADVCLRVDRMLQTMHRECEGKRVIVVCHGEVMWAFRMRLERLSQERWLELDRSQDRRDRMNNGQVIHYSRRNPVTGHIASSLNWSRSIVPCNQDWSRPEWTQITRSAYSNEDLLRVVRAYPRLFDGEY